MTVSEKKSKTNCPDWLDLHLPEVLPDDTPVRHAQPSSLRIYAHSLTLLRSVPKSAWEQRRSRMNPNRFTLP